MQIYFQARSVSQMPNIYTLITFWKCLVALKYKMTAFLFCVFIAKYCKHIRLYSTHLLVTLCSKGQKSRSNMGESPPQFPKAKIQVLAKLGSHIISRPFPKPISCGRFQFLIKFVGLRSPFSHWMSRGTISSSYRPPASFAMCPLPFSNK